MVLNIDSIVESNSLFNIGSKCTLSKVIETIELPYEVVRDNSEEFIVMLIDSVQIFFAPEVFDFGIVNLGRFDTMLIKENALNDDSTLSTFLRIINEMRIGYQEIEFIEDSQINLELDTGSTFIFRKIESDFLFSKILWGKRM